MEKVRKGKKTWTKIVGPAHFKNTDLGESYVYSPQDLVGKKIKVNLSTLENDPRKQNVSIGLKIKEIKGAQVAAETISYEVLPAHVKRMVRTSKDKIDDSFIAICKDKTRVRVKPLVLTRSKTSNAVLTALRKGIKEGFIQKTEKLNFNELLREVISGKMQMGLRNEMKKVYPLSAFEIRKLEVVK